MNEDQKQTLGMRRVRASFNPSNNPTVDRIKATTAELIDTCDKLKDGASGETARCAALAQTAYEEAAMWAVKAAIA
jgi:hypothetical protein